MEGFDSHKRIFSKNAREMRVDLPRPLERLNIIDKVLEGELTITKYVYFMF